MLDSAGKLSVVELIVFTPCIFLSAYVSFKHGFGRQAGWLFLMLFSLVRVIGNASQVAFEVNHDTTAIEIADILSSVGLSPLVLAMLSFIKRVNEGIAGRGLNARIFYALHVAILVGLVLSIVGGTDQFNFSNPSEVSTGRTLVKAGICIFMANFLVLSAIAVYTMLQVCKAGTLAAAGEKRIMLIVLASIPFLMVRLIYSMITAFSSSGSTVFSLTSTATTAVVVRAVMAFLEEFATEALYIGAGFLAPVIPRASVQPGRRETKIRSGNSSDGVDMASYHQVGPNGQEPIYGQQAAAQHQQYHAAPQHQQY
ncbi:MAG: hypothetical protein M4579_003134 [Chaenotheca gracillima]|nr:MAG: hypothetical protein M4579_003134 [Chaenotheca gracillima]